MCSLSTIPRVSEMQWILATFGGLTSPSTWGRQKAYPSFNPDSPCCQAVHEYQWEVCGHRATVPLAFPSPVFSSPHERRRRRRVRPRESRHSTDEESEISYRHMVKGYVRGAHEFPGRRSSCVRNRLVIKLQRFVGQKPKHQRGYKYELKGK